MDDEARDPLCLVIWAMATKTQGFTADKLSTATRDSLGTQFLLKAVDASSRLWKIRYKLRDKEIRQRHGVSISAYVKSFRGRDRCEEAEAEENSEEDSISDPEEQGQSDTPHMMEL